MNGAMEYVNIDKLIKYINDNSHVYNMTVIYSTPSTYLEAVHQEMTLVVDVWQLEICS